MSRSPSPARVVAVLGPTNTGKTHLALERMLGYRSGMIGFPLRLLARENYDRVTRIKGTEAVALITGEEKIIPRHAQWFICTVESMPLDRAVEFLAIDEIQLCGDPERGHIFTDRLLHARGLAETMLLGAETIKPLLRRLVPEAEFVTRPRLSQLTYDGPRKLTRLPPRSAIVAFSVAEVYAMAELIRRQRGGAAVVLGALSPRTRNAQVALYQAGEVDYLVATDAIGMGLNMDVDHVAFAAERKFDGVVARGLDASEIGQIAGRAGRHMNDGSFGTTADVPGFDARLVDAVETHHFPPLQRLQWRNSDLRFTSVPALIGSLDRPPEIAGLVRGRDADDRLALASLARDAEISQRAQGPDRVRLLWEVCQIPDFRKSLAEQHSRLLAAIFRHLTGPVANLPPDWLERQISRLDRTDGEIDTLMTRIANVRTWTYISHRGDWMADALFWQERTRALEDRLSDALHQHLTQRFIDRRTALLVRHLKGDSRLASAVSADGRVVVEGEFIGLLQGFQFVADASDSSHAARAVGAAARSALIPEIRDRVAQLLADDDSRFGLDDEAGLTWRGRPVARLQAGALLLQPGVALLTSDWLDAEARRGIEQRLGRWLRQHLAAAFAPLLGDPPADASAAVRGLLFQLAEHLGSMPRQRLAAPLATLTAPERQSLARLGIRMGHDSIFLPSLLKPKAVRLRALLWCVGRGRAPLPPPPAGKVAVPMEQPAAFYQAVGFRPLGSHAVRLDMVERLGADLRRLAQLGPVTPPPLWSSMLGVTPPALATIIAALGYAALGQGDSVTYQPTRRRPPRRPAGKAPDAEGPFAALRQHRPRTAE